MQIMSQPLKMNNCPQALDRLLSLLHTHTGFNVWYRKKKLVKARYIGNLRQKC